MRGDFSTDFNREFQGTPIPSSYNAFDVTPSRITAAYIYLTFARAKNNIDYLLDILGDQPIARSTIPLVLLNQTHDRDGYLAVCFASMAADINAIIDYINANNL